MRNLIPCCGVRLRAGLCTLFHDLGWGRASPEIIEIGTSVKVGLRSSGLVECLGSCEGRWPSVVVNFMWSREVEGSTRLMGFMRSRGRG